MDFDDSRIAQARTENEMLFDDALSPKKKRSDRKRRRKYKFSDKHHTKRGIISAALVIPGVAMIAYAIVIAASNKGAGGTIVGMLPFLSLITSTAGIILAATTFRKPDTIFTFSWIGLIANIIIWLFVASTTAAGL